MALYNSHTDEQLLQLMQNGEESAFTELYNRYFERLLARTVFLLRSAEDAEELLHDIFAKLWKRRAAIQLQHGFHTYIAAILKYEILHKMADKKQRRLKDQAATHHPPALENTTEQYLDFLDLQNRLEASVRQLPEKCQLVFRLSREKGLSEKQIAENLRVSPKTVQNHIHRALQALRSSLKKSARLFS